mgnify:CR=1 FL=1
MNSQDIGALLVMDRSLLDADGDRRVTEAEFRASPQTGASYRGLRRASGRGGGSPAVAPGAR